MPVIRAFKCRCRWKATRAQPTPRWRWDTKPIGGHLPYPAIERSTMQWSIHNITDVMLSKSCCVQGLPLFHSFLKRQGW